MITVRRFRPRDVKWPLKLREINGWVIIDYIAFNFIENQYNSLVAFLGSDMKDPEIKITINNLR